MTNFPDRAATGRVQARLILSLAFLTVLVAGPIGWFRTAEARIPSLDASLWSGAWARGAEKQLLDSLPIRTLLRERATQAEWLCGVHESDFVRRGRPGWLYLESSLQASQELFDAKAPDRSRFWRDAKRQCDEFGVRLIVLIAPDKLHFVAGPDAPAKAAIYDRAIAELTDLEIEVVDPRVAMADRQRAAPDAPLYSRRDTHWTAAGALEPARLTAELLRSFDLGRAAYRWDRLKELMTTTDLTAGLGFTHPGPALRTHEERRESAVMPASLGGGPAYASIVPGAKLALVGDSFADASFAAILATATGAPLDRGGIVGGGGPVTGMRRTLRRVRSGALQPEVLVCVFVERSVTNADWRLDR